MNTGQDRTGQDRTGQDRTGQDRTGQDRTGQAFSAEDLRLFREALANNSPEYAAYLQKFQKEYTTDETFTPQEIYDAVADWVQAEYGIDRARFVRPFYPGGDYQLFDYSGGAVVVDNPPFSIYKQILDFFGERRIPFFLFAPEKTMLKDRRDVCFVSVNQKFLYEGKVSISTGFVTNLEAGLLRNAPTLYSAIEAADKGRRPEKRAKRKLPRELLTVSMLDMMTRNGIDFKLAPEDARFVRRLDCWLDLNGAGYLLSSPAAARLEAARLEAARLEAARLEAAEVIELSEREHAISAALGAGLENVNEM